MDSHFADAIEHLMHNDYKQFKKLVKLHPALLDAKNNKRSLLTFAVLSDCLLALQFLNEQGLQFFDADENGETAVHWAVIADAKECLKHILKVPRGAGERPWALLNDNHDVTPVHLAAKLGMSKTLKMLLDSLANSEKFHEDALDHKGRSPLHFAAACGRVECCKKLLDGRLNVIITHKDAYGQTPLMCAAASTHPGAADVVRLLGMRLEPSQRSARDNKGRTALHLAVLSLNNEIVGILTVELKCLLDTQMPDSDGRTPLHYAAHSGQLEAVEKLLEAKARNQSRDNLLVTPAQYAAMRGHQAVLRRLLQSVEETDQYEREKQSCFLWAVIGDQLEMVKFFLNHYAPDRSYRDKNGYTALHYAAHIGSLPMIKLLVEERWDMHEGDNVNSTPLHLAAGKGSTDVVRRLIMFGANREHTDSQGRTPIFYACLGGQAHTLKIMLTELKCKSEHTDRLGRTALHCAAFAGFSVCLEVLLDDPKCPIYAEDVDQLTALHVACIRGKVDCADVLLRYGAAVNSYSATEDMTPLDYALSKGDTQLHDFLRFHGGYTAYELKTKAASIIQKWWRRNRPRQRLQKR